MIAVRTVVICLLPTFAADTHAQQNADCGVLSLYHLHRILGYQTSLESIEGHLPPARPEGYSMAEIIRCSHEKGVELVGVQLPGGTRAPICPALVFVSRGKHGHFLVIRPVGTSGKLIQLIDSYEEPSVLDAEELYKSPEWTGHALIPKQVKRGLPQPFVYGLGVLILVMASWCVVQVRRRALAVAMIKTPV